MLYNANQQIDTKLVQRATVLSKVVIREHASQHIRVTLQPRLGLQVVTNVSGVVVAHTLVATVLLRTPYADFATSKAINSQSACVENKPYTH